MKLDLSKKSLNEVAKLYEFGIINYLDVRRYLRAWNAGPHFSQAVCIQELAEIRTFDPETQGCMYTHLAKEFGLRL